MFDVNFKMAKHQPERRVGLDQITQVGDLTFYVSEHEAMSLCARWGIFETLNIIAPS